jgi:hypothetical protein
VIQRSAFLNVTDFNAPQSTKVSQNALTSKAPHLEQSMYTVCKLSIPANSTFSNPELS